MIKNPCVVDHCTSKDELLRTISIKPEVELTFIIAGYFPSS